VSLAVLGDRQQSALAWDGVHKPSTLRLTQRRYYSSTEGGIDSTRRSRIIDFAYLRSLRIEPSSLRPPTSSPPNAYGASRSITRCCPTLRQLCTGRLPVARSPRCVTVPPKLTSKRLPWHRS